MPGDVSRMVDYAIWFCRDANLGYDQWNRWAFPAYGDKFTPGECDCSSLVYHCAELAGFNVPTSGTRYTGTMLRDFRNAGFVWVQTSSTDWQPGDILYKDGHTAIWTGTHIAEAYGDEANGSHGGQSGDQKNETRLSPKRGGWLGYFRYPTPVPKPKPQKVEVEVNVELGTNGVAHKFAQDTYAYEWEKYDDGRLVYKVSDYYNGGNGSAYGYGYYLEKTMPWPHVMDAEAPAFVDVPYITGYSVRASNNLLDLHFNNQTKDKATFWVIATKRAIPKFYVDIKVEGHWK